MKKEGSVVALGLGSNVGERSAYLNDALKEIGRFITNIKVSRIYESPAMLPEGAPEQWNIPFLNMVIAGNTSCMPLAILERIQQIEKAVGRIKRGHWGPREIDIDILLYGDAVIDEAQLSIPHPGLPERGFVLLPLADVLPEWRYPVEGKYHTLTALEMADRVTHQAKVVEIELSGA